LAAGSNLASGGGVTPSAGRRFSLTRGAFLDGEVQPDVFGLEVVSVGACVMTPGALHGVRADDQACRLAPPFLVTQASSRGRQEHAKAYSTTQHLHTHPTVPRCDPALASEHTTRQHTLSTSTPTSSHRAVRSPGTGNSSLTFQSAFISSQVSGPRPRSCAASPH
jgi:hypothetical protein